MPQTLLNKNIKAARKVLDGYPTIYYATLFGSAIRNQLTKESDIDLAIADQKHVVQSGRYDVEFTDDSGEALPKVNKWISWSFSRK